MTFVADRGVKYQESLSVYTRVCDVLVSKQQQQQRKTTTTKNPQVSVNMLQNLYLVIHIKHTNDFSFPAPLPPPDAPSPPAPPPRPNNSMYTSCKCFSFTQNVLWQPSILYRFTGKFPEVVRNPPPPTLHLPWTSHTNLGRTKTNHISAFWHLAPPPPPAANLRQARRRQQ